MPDLPLTLLAPMILILAAALAALRPGLIPRLAQPAGLAALALGLAGLVRLILPGPGSWSWSGVTLARLDAVSVTLVLLVSFVGWVVLRYAQRYLNGEPRAARFHGLTLAAIAAVLVVVQAGNLLVLIAGLAVTGLILRQLLMFYPDRVEARRAAAKFTRVWAAGALALSAGAGLLHLGFGTFDIAALNAAAAGGLPLSATLGVALVVLAALLKTAALPVHGWLTEVMEAPTPVSALLHAGIINAGGVVLITLSPLVAANPGAMAALVVMGGLTALFGALVMLTQSAIKTALAWSTVAQMGFLMLQCGLGLWPLALLHIVAHSLYKAHAFLSSGTAVAEVNAARRPGPVAVPGLLAVVKSFALALALFALVAGAFTWAAGPKSPQALALGTMLIFGVSYLIAQGLADAAPGALTRRTVRAATGAALAYFGFQVLAQALWGPWLPPAPQAGPLEWALIVLAVASFGLVAFAQALFPLWAHHPSTAGLRVHLANGLYLNALFDRITGGFRALAKP